MLHKHVSVCGIFAIIVIPFFWACGCIMSTVFYITLGVLLEVIILLGCVICSPIIIAVIRFNTLAILWGITDKFLFEGIWEYEDDREKKTKEKQW